ncbi:M23 family metallopeptidase [Paenibacillus sp. y28]|uniref:M23 family metallopeptidase n=1 Tax=Paenibacillus sp. y28 TaxID=3129110 RepID=UPI003016D5C5
MSETMVSKAGTMAKEMVKSEVKSYLWRKAGAYLAANPMVIGIIVLVIALMIFMVVAFVALWIPYLAMTSPDTFKEWEAASSAGYVPSYSLPVKVDSDGQEYVWPVPQIRTLSSRFGDREGRGGASHKGMDIAAGKENTEMQPVYAMAAGKVQYAGPASGYGQMISIDHSSELRSIYGHLESAMFVRTGQSVEKGQLIARIGRGIVGTSTGPHLHFQVELAGQAVDPLGYVQPPAIIMPANLSYRAMSIPAMQAWLDKRKSALADPLLLQAIDRAGQAQNVDPHLLIAITGQEQSFVPRNNNHAALIVKNPWNVFGCWCEGRGATLTTEESALIAAKTIVKLSQNRPADVDPISWLNDPSNPNGIYAEHRGWWLGVSKFYAAILTDLGLKS